jgi:hypothetical protein
MAGALAKFAQSGALELADGDAARALRRSADTGSTGGGGGGDFEFLSFSGKRGVYSLGRDKEDVDPQDLFIVEPFAAVEGWTCWKGGRPVGKHEWSAFEPGNALSYADLDDHGPYNEKAGEGWQQMRGIGLIDERGRQIKFTLTSLSGRNVFSDLNNDIADQLEAGEPAIPIVCLGAEDFTAQGQTNSKPVIAVLGWVTRAEVEAYMADDGDMRALLDGGYAAEVEDDEAEPEPQKRRRHRAA